VIERAPFDRMPARERARAVRLLAAAQIALLAPLLALERRMRQAGGPGIIPFEVAGTPQRARRIMERWGDDGRSAARLSLLLDYPFLVTYATIQAIACESAARALERRGHRGMAAAGPPLAWGQLAAGGFDAVENTALLVTLTGRDDRPPRVARAAATAKFALIAAGWTYVGLAQALVRRG
jgi:hypothetical protein